MCLAGWPDRSRRAVDKSGQSPAPTKPACSTGGFFLGGDRGRARTCTPQLRRLMLYPVELRGHAGKLPVWRTRCISLIAPSRSLIKNVACEATNVARADRRLAIVPTSAQRSARASLVHCITEAYRGAAGRGGWARPGRGCGSRAQGAASGMRPRRSARPAVEAGSCRSSPSRSALALRAGQSARQGFTPSIRLFHLFIYFRLL